MTICFLEKNVWKRGKCLFLVFRQIQTDFGFPVSLQEKCGFIKGKQKKNVMRSNVL